MGPIPMDIALVGKRRNIALLAMAAFVCGVSFTLGVFYLGYNAGQSDVITACVKDAEFQRGNDYILCEIED